MKTKNLTIEQRVELVYYMAGYEDSTFYKFYHHAMDMFLKDKGFTPHQREKIKKLNVFKGWFKKQFEKRDEYIINDMLVLDIDSNDFKFAEEDYNYYFYNLFEFKIYYEYLHYDFKKYDFFPFSFDFVEATKKQVGKSFVYQNAYYQEKLEFFFHYS
ncbi:MAG: hypothetical protein GW809_07695 [Bacteroidetes bacterium]|nr:hypothetical protein [Bacteroidota bacterium]